MSIACAKTGKRFSGVETARECASVCHRLGYCPYEQNANVGKVARDGTSKAKVSAEEWAGIVSLIESTSSLSRMQEREIYHHPDGSFEQSNTYAAKVRGQKSWENLHSSEKPVGSNKTINWLILGIILFVIGLFVLVGWVS